MSWMVAVRRGSDAVQQKVQELAEAIRNVSYENLTTTSILGVVVVVSTVVATFGARWIDKKFPENQVDPKKPLQSKTAEKPVQKAEPVQSKVAEMEPNIDSAHNMQAGDSYETGLTGNEGLGASANV